MHGIETGLTGYRSYSDVAYKPAGMWTNRLSCMVTVLCLCCHLPGEPLGVPHNSGTKGQGTTPSLKALCAHSSVCHFHGLAVLGRPICGVLGTGCTYHCPGH